MRIPNELKTAALTEFKHGGDWQRFVTEHGHAIRKAEPYVPAKYRTLRGKLLHVVCTGSESGQFAAGDPDAVCEWLVDDALTQTTLFSTTEPYA